MPLPVIERSFSGTQVFYTDGACMYPRHQMVCVAFGAALRAKADGACETAWCGVLPGACQSIFRAELGGCLRNWVSHETHCRHGFKICLQSSNTTYRVTPTRPQENKDLWAFFLTYLRGTDVDCVQVHWVKGQLNYRNATGLQASPKFMHGSTIGPIWRRKRPFKDTSPLCTKQCCRTSRRKWL